METNDELTGTMVLVHPDLLDDPVQKQGQAGLITFSDAESDEFFVSFGKETALYASDALLAFRKPNDIYANMMDNRMKLEQQDVKDLLRIGTLVNSLQSKDHKAAMEMVMANPNIRAHALMSLEEKLGPLIGAEQGFDMSAGRGR